MRRLLERKIFASRFAASLDTRTQPSVPYMNPHNEGEAKLLLMNFNRQTITGEGRMDGTHEIIDWDFVLSDELLFLSPSLPPFPSLCLFLASTFAAMPIIPLIFNSNEEKEKKKSSTLLIHGVQRLEEGKRSSPRAFRKRHGFAKKIPITGSVRA